MEHYSTQGQKREWLSDDKFKARYRQSDWFEKRAAVLKRDGYCCRRCGERGGRLEVHHTPEAYAMFGHERIEDLLTLCHDCHRKGQITRSEIKRDRQAVRELVILKTILVGLYRSTRWLLKWTWRLFWYTLFGFGLLLLWILVLPRFLISGIPALLDWLREKVMRSTLGKF